MVPMVIDPAVERLEKMAASTPWRKLAARSALETAKRIHSRNPPPRRELSGLDAASYLEAIIPLTQADILEQHNAYGPVRWLWYLRRAPDSLFEGDYATTLGYDRSLAETLSSQFTASDTSESHTRVAFPMDAAAFRHLVRYIGRVKLLSQLHMLYRRVGKGAVLNASGPILVAETSRNIERAIGIYDTRQDRSHEFVGVGLGLASIDANVRLLLEGSAVAEPTAFLSLGCTPGFRAPVTYPDGAGGLTVANVLVRHRLNEFKLSRILSPFGDAGGIPSYLSGIAALIQLLMLVPAICAHVPWALSSITQQGYVFVGEERLRGIIDARLPKIVEELAPRTPGFEWPADYCQWYVSLLAVLASAWPLSIGNVLRQFRDNVMIDTSAASQALLHRLELSRASSIANLRAQEFELQCQDVINATSWEPPQTMKELRGRSLRQDGKLLTDIDAIGTNARTLLIVSCKSIIYDRDYDRGAFQVIRNIQGTIDNAVVKWEGIVDQLRRQPKGENFDLSAFDEIIGVVCTPFAAYSNDERTLAFVKPNLRMSSSILELRDWLADSGAES